MASGAAEGQAGIRPQVPPRSSAAATPNLQLARNAWRRREHTMNDPPRSNNREPSPACFLNDRPHLGNPEHRPDSR